MTSALGFLEPLVPRSHQLPSPYELVSVHPLQGQEVLPGAELYIIHLASVFHLLPRVLEILRRFWYLDGFFP